MEEVLEVVFTTLKRKFSDDHEVIKSIYNFLLDELHQSYFHVMYTEQKPKLMHYNFQLELFSNSEV